MIVINNEFDQKIESAYCDCCKTQIKLNMLRQIPSEHAIIKGYVKSKIINSVICSICLEEKIKPILELNLKDNKIGY